MSLIHLKEGSEMPPFTKGTLRLYSNAYCPFAHRTRLILDAKNISYEKVNINLALKPEWYQKLIPGGQVPCLQLPDGRVLPESLINSEYLDQAYPGPKLAPSDPYENANHKVFVERYSKFIGSFYKAFRGKDDEALAEFKAALDQLEPQLPAKGFLGGDKPAFADYMIWPWLERLGIVERVQSVKFEQEKYPNLLGYIERLKEVPAVKKNFISPEKHYQFYLSYIGSNGGKDANYDL